MNQIQNIKENGRMELSLASKTETEDTYRKISLTYTAKNSPEQCKSQQRQEMTPPHGQLQEGRLFILL